MRSLSAAAAVVLLIAAASAACSPIVRRHGYVPEKATLDEIEPGVDTQQSILRKYGNPSTRGVFEDNTWYYVTNVRERLGYLQPASSARSVYALRFHENGQLAAVDTYNLADGRVVNLVGRETPTRGRELTILEQLLGNVGRLPADSIGGQDNLPGGAGGPRRQ